MPKYKIQSNLLQNGKWQPAYLPPQGINGECFQISEFIEERFDSKEVTDKYVLDHLIRMGVDKDDIEIPNS